MLYIPDNFITYVVLLIAFTFLGPVWASSLRTLLGHARAFRDRPETGSLRIFCWFTVFSFWSAAVATPLLLKWLSCSAHGGFVRCVRCVCCAFLFGFVLSCLVRAYLLVFMWYLPAAALTTGRYLTYLVVIAMRVGGVCSSLLRCWPLLHGAYCSVSAICAAESAAWYFANGRLVCSRLCVVLR